MPLYFFDVLDGDEIILDEEGHDLPDVEAARSEGVKGAREQIGFAAKDGIDATHCVFRIRNEAGEVVVTIPFRETIKRS
jgi:hypothetical protein